MSSATSPSGSVLIEFVGMPGSGKTTLCNSVLEQLRTAGPVTEMNQALRGRSPFSTALRRLWIALSIVTHRPLDGGRLLRYVLRSRQRGFGDFRAVATNLLCKVELMRRMRTRGGSFVSDEGIFHAIWSTSYSAESPMEDFDTIGDTILRMLPDRWILVMVEVDPATAQERVLSRPGRRNRLANDSSLDAEKHRLRAVEAMSAVYETLEGFRDRFGGRIEVLTVRNDDIGDTAVSVTTVLDSLARSV